MLSLFCSLPSGLLTQLKLLSHSTLGSALVQVFSKWRNQKRDAQKKQEEEAIAERKRKGILSGREIFAQVCFPTLVPSRCALLQEVTHCTRAAC